MMAKQPIPGSCREDWVLLIYKINHSTVHLAADAKGRWGFEDMALERRPMTTTIATDARLPAAARAKAVRLNGDRPSEPQKKSPVRRKPGAKSRLLYPAREFFQPWWLRLLGGPPTHSKGEITRGKEVGSHVFPPRG